MYEQSVLRPLRIIESELVPDAPFIKQKRVALCVPVAGNTKQTGSVKVIFHQLRSGLRFVILEEGIFVLQRLGPIVQISDVIGVNDHGPSTVQAGGVARADICNQWSNLCSHCIGKKKRADGYHKQKASR